MLKGYHLSRSIQNPLLHAAECRCRLLLLKGCFLYNFSRSALQQDMKNRTLHIMANLEMRISIS